MTEDPGDPLDQRLLDGLAAMPAIEPPADLPARFHERAAALRVIRRGPSLWITAALAAALVLALGGGWWIDRARQQAEAVRLRVELAKAMTSLSAVQRVAGIDAATRDAVHDEDLADALIVALLQDPNTNVRVAAADALGRIASSATLREAAGRAFTQERSPFVQAALLHAIARLAPADRAAVTQVLLMQSGLDDNLRALAHRAAL